MKELPQDYLLTLYDSTCAAALCRPAAGASLAALQLQLSSVAEVMDTTKTNQYDHVSMMGTAHDLTDEGRGPQSTCRFMRLTDS